MGFFSNRKAQKKAREAAARTAEREARFTSLLEESPSAQEAQRFLQNSSETIWIKRKSGEWERGTGKLVHYDEEHGLLVRVDFGEHSHKFATPEVFLAWQEQGPIEHDSDELPHEFARKVSMWEKMYQDDPSGMDSLLNEILSWSEGQRDPLREKSHQGVLDKHFKTAYQIITGKKTE